MANNISKEVADTLVARDPIWHVQVTILAAIVLQLRLPNKFVFGPGLLLPVLELVLLISLSLTTRRPIVVRGLLSKFNTRFVLILLALGNIYALQQLSHDLLAGGRINNGHALILAGMNIYLTNIIIFALLYWEIDGGGPHRRRPGGKRGRDFLFVEMSSGDYLPEHWVPTFVDYLALSGNTSLAFSPTDTMPLTRSAKLLMLIQAFVALVVVGLIAARAVNILA